MRERRHETEGASGGGRENVEVLVNQRWTLITLAAWM